MFVTLTKGFYVSCWQSFLRGENVAIFSVIEILNSIFLFLNLQNVKDMLDKLGDQIAVIHEKQPDVILEASGQEAVQIGDSLTQLNAEWDRINRMYSDRKR